MNNNSSESRSNTNQILIAPDRINLFSQNRFINPTTVDGNWDLYNQVFNESMLFYTSFKKILFQNISWEKTKYYKDIVNRIKQNKVLWGCKNENDFIKRINGLIKIFIDIKENGYKKSKNGDEISINIGRNGDVIFNDGRHRLVFAKILNLSNIPVNIIGRHSLWVSFKQKVRNYLDKNRHKILSLDLLHPDLHELAMSDDQIIINGINKHLPKYYTSILCVEDKLGLISSNIIKQNCRNIVLLNDKIDIHFTYKLRIANDKNFEIAEAEFTDFVIKRNKFGVTIISKAYIEAIIAQEEIEELIMSLDKLDSELLFIISTESEATHEIDQKILSMTKFTECNTLLKHNQKVLKLFKKLDKHENTNTKL